MPRILSNKPCKLTLQDNISGGSITLGYIPPSSDDRIKYSNSIITRKGRKIDSTMGETRAKYGKKILDSITDGDFVREDGKPLSSNPSSPDYDPKWKDLVCEFAPDVVAMLAIHVFEVGLTISEAEEEENPT
jgi:hypothetical protein